MENKEGFMSKASTIEFRRPLNRDPDKHFDKLPTNEKILVSSLRATLEEAKNKIDKLRDDNDRKDDIIEDERSRRLELEEKMEKYLVDLYSDPKVNDELHQRLPKAKKKGNLLHRGKDGSAHTGVNFIDTAHDAGSESSEAVEGFNNGIQQQGTGVVSDSNHLHIVTGSEDHKDMMTSSLSSMQSSTHHMSQPAAPGPYLAGLPALSGYPQQSYYPHLYPPYLPSHTVSSTSMSSFASSSYVGLPSGTKQDGAQETTQHSQRPLLDPVAEDKSLLKDHDHLQQGGAPFIYNSVNPGMGNVSGIQSQQGMTTQLYATAGLMSPMMSSSFINSADRTDNVSHITRLLQEISILKTENRELKMELKDQKRDLEMLKMQAGQVDENKNTEAIAALIEEVQRAEKAGEKAVSQLVQSANDDRNAALHELDRLRLKAAKRDLPLDSSSQTDGSVAGMEENEKADSIVSCDLDLESAVSEREELKLTSQHVKKMLDRQKEMTKQQMEEVIAQRDKALFKVATLKKKLSSLQLSEFPSTTNQTLQAKLRITEKERDIAVGKLKLLSQDMSEVTLMCNLQKVLLTDEANLDTANRSSGKLTNNVAEQKTNNMSAHPENADKDKAKWHSKIKFLEKENSEKEKRIEKLEELVLRQRKKLNTLCAGPLLMED